MLPRLNYLWRLLLTGVAFTAFGLGGLMLSICVIPLLSVFSRSELARVKRVRKVIHWCFYGFTLMLRVTGVLDYSVRNKERLISNTGRLVIANHPSLLDVVFLISFIPDAQCVVKYKLWDNWFIGRVVRAAGYIRNDENTQNLFEQCQKEIEQGFDIVIFPEGTRTEPGQSPKFHRGFANIAVLTPCDIVPVVISCNHSGLSKGRKWYNIPDTKGQFDFTVEPQINMNERIEKLPRSKAVRKLTRDLELFYEGKICNA